MANIAGQHRLACCTIDAQDPMPGSQVCLGHPNEQHQQNLVGQAPLDLCKQLLMVRMGHAQEGHTQGAG